VCDAAGQLADRLHLLGLCQRGPRQLQGFFGRLLFGQIAGDFDKADKLAMWVADRVDHGFAQSGAVLAHAPAFRS